MSHHSPPPAMKVDPEGARFVTRHELARELLFSNDEEHELLADHLLHRLRRRAVHLTSHRVTFVVSVDTEFARFNKRDWLGRTLRSSSLLRTRKLVCLNNRMSSINAYFFFAGAPDFGAASAFFFCAAPACFCFCSFCLLTDFGDLSPMVGLVN